MKKPIIIFILIFCSLSNASETTNLKSNIHCEKKSDFDDFNYDVKAMCWSPNGINLACAIKDCSIVIINTIDNSRKILDGHENGITTIKFSPNGQFLASGSDDMTIKIWETQTWENIHTLKAHTNSVDAITFSNDSSLFASGSRDETIKIWNTKNWKCLKTLVHRAYVTEVLFSKDKTTLISYSKYNNTFKKWDMRNYARLENYQDKYNNTLHSADMTKILKIYDSKTQLTDCSKNKMILKLKQQISFASFSHDCTKLRYVVDNQIFIKDLTNRNKPMRILSLADNIQAISWSNDGTKVAINLPNCLEVWSVHEDTDEQGYEII
jgi:WD40 repeat protein